MGGFGPIIGGILLHELPLRTVFFIFATPAILGAMSVLSMSWLQLRRKSQAMAQIEARA
jgi:uncharacterized membrane protein YeiH